MTENEHTGTKHAPVYLDNAATTKMSQASIRTALPYMDGIYANPSAVHPAGQAAVFYDGDTVLGGGIIMR